MNMKVCVLKLIKVATSPRYQGICDSLVNTVADGRQGVIF